MARQTQAATRYRVLNPRGINPGVRILSSQGVSYYADDEFTPSARTNQLMLNLWLREGYLEVIDG